MSDCNGPTFDEEFDEWDRELREWLYAPTKAATDRLRTFMATVRSEMGSRRRAFDDLLTERAGLIGARAGSEARAKGLAALDRQRFDVLRDDYEKVQVALASTRLAMVEMDRVTRERNEARAEVGHLRLLLSLCPECGTSIVWYDGMVRCDPDLGCVWVEPLLDGEGPAGERREKALRRLADEWKVTR